MSEVFSLTEAVKRILDEHLLSPQSEDELRAALAAHEIQQFETRSSVQIDQTAKQVPMLRVKVYAGETDKEMQRVSQLALDTYNNLINRLGARANFT